MTGRETAENSGKGKGRCLREQLALQGEQNSIEETMLQQEDAVRQSPLLQLLELPESNNKVLLLRKSCRQIASEEG